MAGDESRPAPGGQEREALTTGREDTVRRRVAARITRSLNTEQRIVAMADIGQVLATGGTTLELLIPYSGRQLRLSGSMIASKPITRATHAPNPNAGSDH